MRAYLFAAVPIILWASTPLLVTELTTQLPVLQINWLATAFSILFLSITLSARRGWEKLRSYSRADLKTMLLLGATGLFPYTALYYLAFALAPAEAGSSNIINYLWPIWVVVLAVPILKEKLDWKKVLGIMLSFAGVYIVVTGGRWLHLRRDHLCAYLCAGAGAFFWGLFSVQNKRFRFDALTAMWTYNLGAFPCFAVVALIASPLVWPTPRSWLLLLLLGGIVNGFSYLFWIMALHIGDTAKIANLVYITPFLALVYLSIFQKRPIAPVQLLALILVISGPIIQSVHLHSKHREFK
jgi:drug/metabolite transporter (DMT)-like permease